MEKEESTCRHAHCTFGRLDIRWKLEVGLAASTTCKADNATMQGLWFCHDNLDGSLGRTLGKATMASNWYKLELVEEVGDGSRMAARPIDLDTYYTCIGTQ